MTFYSKNIPHVFDTNDSYSKNEKLKLDNHDNT